MQTPCFRFVGTVLLCSLFSGASNAQQLVYTPNNPSFGGNSFNSNHLLGIANGQKPQKPGTARKATPISEIFLQQLQRRLVSGLAANVTDAIFGDDPQDSGTVSFGDQVVTFERGIDSVHLTVSDVASGSVTEIDIPVVQ